MATERFNINDHEIYVAYFRAYADKLKPLVHGEVLDLGCGEGWLTKELAALPSVTSILAVDKFSDQPAENHDEKIEYVASDIPSEFSTDKQFDTVVSTEFIEHITEEHLRLILPKIKTWLKPGGIFLGSTPDRIVPTTNEFHLKEYTIAELESLFAEFKLVGQFSNPIKGLIIWNTKSV